MEISDELAQPLDGRLRTALIATASVELLLGLVVIAGWYAGSVTLTQILPHFAPMQYNTALGFVLSAVGLLAMLFQRSRVAGGAGLLLLLLSGATMIQYLFDIDVGIDQFFVEVSEQARTSHPGRPSPNTTFCFLLTSILLFSEFFRDRLSAWPQRYWIFGLLILTSATVVMLGYIIAVPTAYGWGHLMRMALHTASGFVLTGSVLLGYVWLTGRPQSNDRRQLLTMLVAVLGLIMALFNYQVILLVQEQSIREEKQRQVDLMVARANLVISDSLTAFQRLVDRRSSVADSYFRSRDIASYMDDMPNLLSVGLFDLGTRDYERLAGRNHVMIPTSVELDAIAARLNEQNGVILYWQDPELWFAIPANGHSKGWVLFELQLARIITSVFDSSGNIDEETRLIISASPEELDRALQDVRYLDPALFQRYIDVEGFQLLLTLYFEPRLLFAADKRILVMLIVGVALAVALALSTNWFLRNRALHRQLVSVQDSSTTGLVGSDLMGHVRFCNQAALDMFGYSEEEMLTLNIEDLLPPDLRAHHIGLRRGLQGQRVSRKLESRRLQGHTKTGEDFPVDIGIGFSDTESGMLVISSIVDMRKQRELEAELASRHSQLALLLDSVGEGVFGIDRHGYCTFVNPVACDILGYEQDELLGHMIHELIQYKRADGSACPWYESTICRALNAQSSWKAIDEIFWRKDRTSFPVEFVANPILEEVSETAAVVVFSDVTVRRNLEQMQKLHTERLEQINQDLEEFSYVASHDLKEPLRTLKSFCAFLREDLGDSLSEDVDRDLRYIDQAADRMQLLINDLLEFSRAGSQEMHLGKVDLHRLLPRIVENLDASIRESDARVDIADLPAVRGDAHQLERVFQNLLSNAIKFHGDRPPVIEVAADINKQSSRATVRVSDQGIGIRDEYQDKIFGAFKRLHSMDEIEGSGIGLAVVKKLIDRQGGRVWFESEEGVGTTFFVELPLYNTWQGGDE